MIWFLYRPQEREDRILETTAGVGADLVLELGGAGTLPRSMTAAKINGRISLVGVLSGDDGRVNPVPIMRKSLTVNGIYVGSGQMQADFHRALQTGRLHPVVDRVFGFDQTPEAYAYLQSARHFGKVVIRLDS